MLNILGETFPAVAVYFLDVIVVKLFVGLPFEVRRGELEGTSQGTFRCDCRSNFSAVCRRKLRSSKLWGIHERQASVHQHPCILFYVLFLACIPFPVPLWTAFDYYCCLSSRVRWETVLFFCSLDAEMVGGGWGGGQRPLVSYFSRRVVSLKAGVGSRSDFFESRRACPRGMQATKLSTQIN